MLDTFGRPAATPRVLVCALLLMVLGACGTPVEGSCENKGGTLRVPNNGRVWTVDYEPTGVEVRLQVTLEGSAGPAQASSQMSLPESWVVFTQPGRGADHQLVIVPWPDGATDIAWLQEVGERESPAQFNRLEMGCSDALGYAALPGISNEVALFRKNDAGEWVEFALVQLIAGGVVAGFNVDEGLDR